MEGGNNNIGSIFIVLDDSIVQINYFCNHLGHVNWSYLDTDPLISLDGHGRFEVTITFPVGNVFEVFGGTVTSLMAVDTYNPSWSWKLSQFRICDETTFYKLRQCVATGGFPVPCNEYWVPPIPRNEYWVPPIPRNEYWVPPIPRNKFWVPPIPRNNKDREIPTRQNRYPTQNSSRSDSSTVGTVVNTVGVKKVNSEEVVNDETSDVAVNDDVVINDETSVTDDDTSTVNEADKTLQWVGPKPVTKQQTPVHRETTQHNWGRETRFRILDNDDANDSDTDNDTSSNSSSSSNTFSHENSTVDKNKEQHTKQEEKLNTLVDQINSETSDFVDQIKHMDERVIVGALKKSLCDDPERLMYTLLSLCNTVSSNNSKKTIKIVHQVCMWLGSVNPAFSKFLDAVIVEHTTLPRQLGLGLLVDTLTRTIVLSEHVATTCVLIKVISLLEHIENRERVKAVCKAVIKKCPDLVYNICQQNLKGPLNTVLDSGCFDPSIVDGKGETILFAALNSPEMFEYLLSKCFRGKQFLLGKPNKSGYTVLHTAVIVGKLEIIKLLIEKGQCVTDVKDRKGKTPLEYAAICRNKKVFQYLTLKACEERKVFVHNLAPDLLTDILTNYDCSRIINIKTENGCTPLLAILVLNDTIDISIIRLLLSQGAHVNAQNIFGQTPLHVIATKTHSKDIVEVVQLLLEAGANPCLKDSDNMTALHLTLLVGLDCKPRTEYTATIVQLLVSQGHADPNEIRPDSNGYTPLHVVLTQLPHDKCTEKLVQVLLDHKADPNSKDDNEYTPLHAVLTKLPHSDCAEKLVQVLLDHKADPNSKDDNGKTVLETALIKALNPEVRTQSTVTIIQKLLVQGANPNNLVDSGYTLLHLVVSRPHDKYIRELVEILLDHGADPNIKYKGDTSLHIAMSSSPYSPCIHTKWTAVIAQLLFQKGHADPNTKNKDGKTAMHLASSSANRNEHTELTIRILLHHGADPKDKLPKMIWI